MNSFGRLVVYVTNHGYGHLNRTVAVLNRLPTGLPITIRCDPELFPKWGERLLRPAALEAYASDCGTIAPSDDHSGTDAVATLDQAARLHGAAMHQIEGEAEALRSLDAAAVLCDAPWVPLVAAARAKVPAFVLANFLWSEIYAEHAETLGPAYIAFVAEVRAAYRQATLAFRAEPALPMRDVAERVNVGMVLTHGRDRRSELCREFRIDPTAKLVSIYVGRYGHDQLPWERLGEIPDTHFVTYHRLFKTRGPLPNVHTVSAADWSGGDLAASVDVAVAKAGYGSVCEAMSSGTPLIYPPRAGFAEFAALDSALKAWGGGVPMTAAQYENLDLGSLLKHALRLRPGSPAFLAAGAARVADALLARCRRA